MSEKMNADTNAVKALYYAYQNSKEYAALDGQPETKDAAQRFENYAKKLERYEHFDLEEIVGWTAAANEMQGFVYGFRYAVQLILGCMPTGSTKAVI